MPFYLHPRNPLPGTIRGYEGHNWLLGPNWAFHAETAVHALRLIGSGLFDEHPKLQIILGHLGEGIPAYLWRIDHRNGWMKARHRYAAKKSVADYFRNNFVLTTSGNFSTSALDQAIAEIGVERVLWSADYPFEDISDAADWFDAAPLERSRPAEDRPHQRAETVQAEEITKEKTSMKFVSIAAARSAVRQHGHQPRAKSPKSPSRSSSASRSCR